MLLSLIINISKIIGLILFIKPIPLLPTEPSTVLKTNNFLQAHLNNAPLLNHILTTEPSKPCGDLKTDHKPSCLNTSSFKTLIIAFVADV